MNKQGMRFEQVKWKGNDCEEATAAAVQAVGQVRAVVETSTAFSAAGMGLQQPELSSVG